MFSVIRRCFWVACYFTAASAAQATDFTYTIVNPPGSKSTYITSLNENGDAVGAVNRPRATNGFIYSKRRYTTLKYPGASITQPWGINNSGQVIGTYFSNTELAQSFLYQDGTFTKVNIPGSESVYAYGINDDGVISGFYYVLDSDGTDTPGNHPFTLAPDGTLTKLPMGGDFLATASRINKRGSVIGVDFFKPFIFSDGVVNLVPLPANSISNIVALNDNDTVVGSYIRPGEVTFTGFASTDANVLDIRSPGFSNTSLASINTQGAMIGNAWNDSKSYAGFLRNPKGEFTAIAPPDAVSTELWEINDKGQIGGSFLLDDGTRKAFIATPKP